MKAVQVALHADNRAIYLPAISKGYAVRVARGGPIGGTGWTYDDLDFLSPGNRLFHYPYALYSGGPAAPKKLGSPPIVDMVSQRQRDSTIIVGDSGGYQIQTGAIPFDATTPGRMMRWMEAVSDWSMVLDFPTGGIVGGVMAPHIERLRREGLDLDGLNAANRMGVDFNACLLQTQLNNDYFLTNRTPGATGFLNVLQGRNERESRFWYEHVRHYPFEGWAFAGAHQNSFSLILARLLDMRDDGILQTLPWLHVLGVSTLPVGALLTSVQRAVRQHVNPDFQVSFDTSSPFQGAVYQTVNAGHTLDKESWDTRALPLSSIPADRNGDNLGGVLAELIDGEARPRRVTRTAVSRSLTLGDLRQPGTDLISPDGTHLLMFHNVEALIDAHEEAHWRLHGHGLVSDVAAKPMSIKTIAGMIDVLFSGKGLTRKPQEHVLEWRDWLDALRS